MTAMLTRDVSVSNDGGMTRRAAQKPRPVCAPTGLPAPAPVVDRRHCVHCPGVTLEARPNHDRSDWRYVDVETGLSTVDNAPPALREDPAKWWADLFEASPQTYSSLKAAQDLGCHSWYHMHTPGGSVEDRPAGMVPHCCGSPMWAAPDGWVCRVAGYRSQPRPYAPEVPR